MLSFPGRKWGRKWGLEGEKGGDGGENGDFSVLSSFCMNWTLLTSLSQPGSKYPSASDSYSRHLLWLLSAGVSWTSFCSGCYVEPPSHPHPIPWHSCCPNFFFFSETCSLAVYISSKSLAKVNQTKINQEPFAT